MNYVAFSDQTNIETMVRRIQVFIEEQTLVVNILDWEGNPYRRNIGHWVKYASTNVGIPRQVYLYWDTKVEDEFQAQISQHLEEPGGFKHYQQHFYAGYAQFKTFSDRCYTQRDAFPKQTNAELIQWFDEFLKHNHHLLCSYYIAYDLSVQMCQRVDLALRKLFPEDQAASLFRIFSTYAILPILGRERRAFLSRIKSIQNLEALGASWQDISIQNHIFQHWYDYGSCVYTQQGDKFSLKDMQASFLKERTLDVEAERTQHNSAWQKEEVEVKNSFELLAAHPNLQADVYWLRIILGWRANEAEEMDPYYYVHCQPFFDEVNARLGNLFDGYRLLSNQEIRDGLSGEKTLAEITALIQARIQHGYTIKQVGDKIMVYTGVRPEDQHQARTIETQTELKGTVVFPGVVTGRAKIITDPLTQSQKFETGDILISPMTMPSFVPLMKRAAAIVTDEGGMLCHAAIVSRELNKPCLVGTKTATRTFQDGDLVEVNANTRSIKKI